MTYFRFIRRPKNDLMRAVGLMLIVLLSVQCKKKDPTPDPTPQNTIDLQLIQDFVNENKKPAENFTFDATQLQNLTTNYGSTISIMPYSLVDENGTPYTGSVKLSVLEIHEPGDMILANLTTNTPNGEILESGGMLLIEALDDQNNPLQVADSQFFRINIPAGGQANPEMRGWEGDTSKIYTVSGRDYQNNLVSMNSYVDPGVNWNIDPGSQVISAGNQYLLTLDSIGEWVNVDALKSYTQPRTTFFGYLDVYNDSTLKSYMSVQPSMLFFKPNGSNSLIKLYNVILSSPSQYSGFHSYQNSMPVGLMGSFLAVSVKNGKFYAQKLSNTAIPAPQGTANYSFLNFNLQELSEAELLVLLKSM